MLRLIKQVFIVLLTFSRSSASTVNAPDHIKSISVNKQQCMTQPTLITFHPNECIQDYVTIYLQLI